MYSSSTALYLPMGWVVVVVVAPAPLVARMPSSFLVLLISGSLRYSLGASVFLFDNCVHCAHFVRHLFVLGAVRATSLRRCRTRTGDASAPAPATPGLGL